MSIYSLPAAGEGERSATGRDATEVEFPAAAEQQNNNYGFTGG